MSICSVGEVVNEECHKTVYGAVSTSLKQLSSFDDREQKLLKLRISNGISTICQYHYKKFVLKYNHLFGYRCLDPLKIHKKRITKDLREIKLENISIISPANPNVCLIPGKSLCQNCHSKLFGPNPESVPNDPLKTYKRYLRTMGINIRNYDTFFKDCRSIKAKKEKMLSLMRENGLKDNPTLEKCKKIRKKIEKKKEIAELDLDNIIEESGRGRRNVASLYQTTQKSRIRRPVDDESNSD